MPSINRLMVEPINNLITSKKYILRFQDRENYGFWRNYSEEFLLRKNAYDVIIAVTSAKYRLDWMSTFELPTFGCQHLRW